jgi:hypothetical protein
MSGLSHCLSARVLLENKRLEEALSEAALAQRYGEGNLAEWMGIFLQSISKARSGQFENTLETAERLEDRTKSIPSRREERRLLHLQGELARIQGDTAGALDKLLQAESMLPANGFGGVPGSSLIGPQPYVPIWYSLGLNLPRSR